MYDSLIACAGGRSPSTAQRHDEIAVGPQARQTVERVDSDSVRAKMVANRYVRCHEIFATEAGRSRIEEPVAEEVMRGRVDEQREGSVHVFVLHQGKRP